MKHPYFIVPGLLFFALTLLMGVCAAEGEPGLADCPEACGIVCVDAPFDPGAEDAVRFAYELAGTLGASFDPDTSDLDENGIVDAAHFRLVDAVLDDDTNPLYCCVRRAWNNNYPEVNAYVELVKVDPTASLVVQIMTEERLEHLLNALATIGEESAFQVLVDLFESLDDFPLPNFDGLDTSAAKYLASFGDLDRDGVCNLGEYNAVVAGPEDFPAFEAAALDPVLLADGGGCPACVPDSGEGEAEELVQMSLVSQTTLTAVGDTFGVVVRIRSGGTLVDTANVYLNFDPAVLELVSITPDVTFDTVHESVVDNTSGQADFRAAISSGGTYGTFSVATLVFNALAESPSSALIYNKADPRVSDLLYQTVSMLEDTQNGDVVVRTQEEVGCDAICDRDWSEGCSGDASPLVDNYWAGDKVTDVTFVAFGDSQIDSGAEDRNPLCARAINATDLILDWESAYFGFDAPVAKVRGVLMAGDITHHGRDGRYYSSDNIEEFTDVYGLCGNALLKFPIFEGYGNHDYFTYEHLGYRLDEAHPVADMVSQRNPYRAGLSNTAPGTDGHYSWDWDNVHFVQLNLCASDLVPSRTVPGDRDPRRALNFLEQDLLDHVYATQKRVVIITHYGFYSSWDFNGWWTTDQADAYHSVIQDYDVIAHLHGHAHNTATLTWRGIPVFNLGSAYYASPQWNSDGRGRFSIFRITNDKLYAGDAAWNPNNPEGDILFPSRWYRVEDLQPTIDGGVITSSVPPDEIELGIQLTLTAPEGSGYEWRKDGFFLPPEAPRLTGNTSRNLKFSLVVLADSGTYVARYDKASKGAKTLVQTDPFELVVNVEVPAYATWLLALLTASIAAAGANLARKRPAARSH